MHCDHETPNVVYVATWLRNNLKGNQMTIAELADQRDDLIRQAGVRRGINASLEVVQALRVDIEKLLERVYGHEANSRHFEAQHALLTTAIERINSLTIEEVEG